jgi:hypothetical protein
MRYNEPLIPWTQRGIFLLAQGGPLAWSVVGFYVWGSVEYHGVLYLEV